MMDLYKKKIDETLLSLIPETSTFFPSLYAAGKYALQSPGKRIRPLLTLCTAEMLKEGATDVALIPACALEMVHTYSLIHDDLPCMDDDDFRRGLPTLHRVYTEGHAVLVGDYLLTYAFEVIATAPSMSCEQKVALIKTLATAAGSEGMIGGQIMDIEQSQHIEQMHLYKTAKLFCAAVEFGGIIAESSAILPSLRTFGIHFGKLFQLVDDLLDDDHPLGREKAKESALIAYERATQALKPLPGNSIPLSTLLNDLFSKIPETVSVPRQKTRLARSQAAG